MIGADGKIVGNAYLPSFEASIEITDKNCVQALGQG